ncbi:hypothetical protein A7982_13787 [Minicystis rosea]|nr:hypothetical protein A7982_13787 [Minicystis rosea]
MCSSESLQRSGRCMSDDLVPVSGGPEVWIVAKETSLRDGAAT